MITMNFDNFLALLSTDKLLLKVKLKLSLTFEKIFKNFFAIEIGFFLKKNNH